MSKKITLAILCGGKSAEHEVSLQSAKNVVDAIDKNKYEVIVIGIDKKGHWYAYEPENFIVNPDDPQRVHLKNSDNPVAIVNWNKNGQLFNLSTHQSVQLDVVFPILHGPFGEDGTIQGLLKLADIPFVGTGILASAAGMDKDVTKRLLRDAGIPNAKFLVLHKFSKEKISFEKVKDYLGLPVFIKPINLGSSVGINKASDKKQFESAIREAFEYDTKILVEENIKGREIECAVLGNYNPAASIAGEIIPQHDFYSYTAKYTDKLGAVLKAPAELPENLVKQVQKMAIQVFKVLNCEGMSRVDFFLKENGELLINEINTIPGFTKISMYPKLWELSGIPYSELIDRLIQLAIERFKNEKQLKTSH